jgi:hypothetical protein
MGVSEITADGMGVSVKVGMAVKTGCAVSVFATMVESFSSLEIGASGAQAVRSKSTKAKRKKDGFFIASSSFVF